MVVVVSTLLTDQAEAPPVGLVEVTSLPSWSAATQRFEMHETLVIQFSPSTLAATHEETPPVGLVEVKTLPNESVATHRVVEWQEMSVTA